MLADLEAIDTSTSLEATLRALHELYLVHDAELLPNDPPVPMAQRLVDWRHVLGHYAVPRWVVWQEGRVVATSGMYLPLEYSLENAYGWVYVHPEHRRAGLARVIAAPMFDEGEKEGRTRFAFTINEGRRVEEELAARGGLKSAYREQVSRLSFQNIDWELMESWVARRVERAPDYELLFLESPIEERHLEPFCDLLQVMNTAPSEDLVDADEVTTPVTWRDTEAKMRLREQDILIYVARHVETGDFAGLTSVSHHRLQPDLVEQWDTGVGVEHRNKGLGRWLKAAMALKLRDEYPQVERIDTENAGSNEPMLAINIEMGFEPVLIQNIWQGELATLRERLSV